MKFVSTLFLAALFCFSGCKGGHHHASHGNLFLICSTNELGEIILSVNVPADYFGLLSEADANGKFGPADAFVASYVVNKGVRPAGTYSFRLELDPADDFVNTNKFPSFIKQIVETCSVTVNPQNPIPSPEPDPTPSPPSFSLVCSTNTSDGCVSITVHLDGEGEFTLRRLDNSEVISVVDHDTVVNLHLSWGSYTFQLLDNNDVPVAQCTIVVPDDTCQPPDDSDPTPCPDLVSICHLTAHGEHRTLVLPRPAAEAHLASHANDFLGSCNDDQDESCNLWKGNKRCVIKKKHLEQWMKNNWWFCNDSVR